MIVKFWVSRTGLDSTKNEGSCGHKSSGQLFCLPLGVELTPTCCLVLTSKMYMEICLLLSNDC